MKHFIRFIKNNKIFYEFAGNNIVDAQMHLIKVCLSTNFKMA